MRNLHEEGGRLIRDVGSSEVAKLYGELASSWPLLSAPSDYSDEAAFDARTLTAACEWPLRTLLELGSGGGNNASHLKRQFQMALVNRPSTHHCTRTVRRGACGTSKGHGIRNHWM